MSAIFEKLMSRAENGIRYAVLTQDIPVISVLKYLAMTGRDTFTIVPSRTVRKQAIAKETNANIFSFLFIEKSSLKAKSISYSYNN
jgi:hypothetical protein